jgi:hypothetical protein
METTEIRWTNRVSFAQPDWRDYRIDPRLALRLIEAIENAGHLTLDTVNILTVTGEHPNITVTRRPVTDTDWLGRHRPDLIGHPLAEPVRTKVL